MTMTEVIEILHTHYIECDQSTVGTAFEEGISDKVRIERLLKYIQKLEEEMEELRWGKTLLEFELGIIPFN